MRVITLSERQRLLYLAATDLSFRKDFAGACKDSAPFFLSTCCWINEPRQSADLRDVPFLLRAFQWDYIENHLQKALDLDKSLLTDKTREMGVTWMVIGLIFWAWIFQRRFSALCGSITEDKIDSKNNINTLFWKFDYLLESLKISAPWFYPGEYNEKKHRQHMKRFNPQNESSFVGEVMGPNFGRSGRNKLIFLDEFAEAPYPASTWAACSRTSNCKIVVFTPKGMNYAGRLANPSHGKPRTIPRCTLHWMVDESKNKYIIRDGDGSPLAEGHGAPDPAIYEQHPTALRPYYPWYEEAKKGLNYDPVMIAQELDVNYNESVEGQIYPQIERARFGKVEYDARLKLYCSMDYGLSDMTAFVWFQWHPADRRFKVIDAYQNNGKTIKWYVPFMLGPQFCALGQAEGGYTPYEMEVIERHSPFYGRYTAFYGDPAGKQRNPVTSTSVIQVLAESDIFVLTNEKAKRFEPRKQALGAMLPFCDFDDRNCADLIQALRDSRHGPNGNPVHGPESHYRSAMEYGAVNQPHGISLSDEEADFLPELDKYKEKQVAEEADNPFAVLNARREEALRMEKLMERLAGANKFGGGEGRTGYRSSGGGRGMRGGWGRRR